MEITNLFDGIYHGRKVLVTGHTGFKGSWLAFWLSQMGAEVHGISLDPPTNPNHLSVLEFDCHSLILDITRREEFATAVGSIRPEIIFHLAAQPLVRLSYEQPYDTYLTNVMGTVNVLEAARHTDSVKAVIVVTSDKCYDNREWVWGYRENEPMGGKDPYSSSKGCAELVTAAYRHSYFHPAAFGTAHNVLVATARAGNVIGGGDWALDRIVPDLVRAAATHTRLMLRYPGATRPWQHVLEPLSGYLMIGCRLLQGKSEFGRSWNFGPSVASNLSVLELVSEAAGIWKEVAFETGNGVQPHEAGYLMLDSSLAKKELQWDTVWDFKTTVSKTIGWYKDFYNNSGIRTADDLACFIGEATGKSILWTQSSRS